MKRLCSIFILLLSWLTADRSAYADHDGLQYRWQFDAQHVFEQVAVPLSGELGLTSGFKPEFDSLAPHSMIFDAARRERMYLESEIPFTDVALPSESLTAEAWVRIDKTAEWGGLIGAIQDNGNYERGWLVGYRQSRFFFAVATSGTKRLTYLQSSQQFDPGNWYQVVGTWDGSRQRLYVDGQLVAESKEQSGDILYPPSAHFGAGAYWDDDEFHGLTGQLFQASVWNRAIDAAEVLERFERHKADYPGIEAQPPAVVDWPTYRRDNQRTGLAVEKQLEFPLHLRWVYRTRYPPAPAWPPPARQNFWGKQHELKSRVNFDRSTPVIGVGNRLFLATSADDQVVCLDRRTGTTLWRFTAEAPVRLAPTFDQGRVLFGSDDGCVYCLNANTGSLLWTHRPVPDERQVQGNGRIMSVWPIRSGILIDDQRAIFCAGLFPEQGAVHAAIDARTGQPIDQAPISISPQGYLERRASQLFVSTGRNLAGAFVSQLSRRGKSVGREVRSIPEQFPYAFIGDAKARYGGGDGQVAAFDISDGRQLWTSEVDGRAYEMAIVGSDLIVSTDRGAVYCFGDSQPESMPLVTSTISRAEEEVSLPSDRSDVHSRDEELAGRIVSEIPSDRGWGLILNPGSADLALALARRTQLRLIVVEHDSASIQSGREQAELAMLSDRITYHQARAKGQLPYTDYLFNVVIDVAAVKGHPPWPQPDELKRVLRPGGGVALLGPSPSPVFRRAELSGTGQWTHQYADPGNTVCSNDLRVQGTMRLQWFGPPGPRVMMDRHHRTAAPLTCAGRMFIPANNAIIAADIYNGTPLWQREIPDSRRAGVYRDCSYLAASPDRLYVAAADHCLGLNTATGHVEHQFDLPGLDDSTSAEWGYVATVDDALFGTRQTAGASRRDHSLAQIYEGTYFDNRPVVCSHEFFALNRHSGRLLWDYTPDSGVLINSTIAIADGRVYFVETTEENRSSGNRGRYRLGQLFSFPAILVALDMHTGETIWRQPIDLSGIEHNLYLSATRGRLVLAGSYNRRLGQQSRVNFDISTWDATTGDLLWQRTQDQGWKAGGEHGEQDLHPVIVGQRLFCEPYAYDLETGEPMAGWGWNPNHRHGCGTISASANSFFFRHSTPTMFDLSSNQYDKVTSCTRPGCWINMIPAGGLLLVPEASSGCVCNFAIQSSMAFLPGPPEAE